MLAHAANFTFLTSNFATRSTTSDIVAKLGSPGDSSGDINDYTYASEALRVNKTIAIEVVRAGETWKLEVTRGARN